MQPTDLRYNPVTSLQYITRLAKGPLNKRW